MRMAQRRTRVLWLSALASLALALPASAAWYRDDSDNVPPLGASIGGRAMYSIPKNTDAHDGTWFGGAQLRFYLTHIWAIEGSADYRRIKVPGGRIDDFPVQASLLAYLLPNSPVTPFILAGAGWYFIHTDVPGTDHTTNSFGPHVGGGLQWFFQRHWSIDATYRYVWIETNRPDNPLDANFTDQGHMITAALNYHF